MKSLSYILFAILLIVMHGCKEEDHPYVGYLDVERAVLEPEGGSVTVTAQTDLSDPLILVGVNKSGEEWCTASVSGREITITATKPNPNAGLRTTTVSVRCGTRLTDISVLQKYEGQQYLEYDWARWEAVGSDVQVDPKDGGGYAELFKDDRTTFWHSQYSPAIENPLTHWLLIDMKKEQPIAMVRIGRRHHAPNGNNYATVKTMEIHVSTDKENFTKVGGFTFPLPWTAPDGTVVTSTTSPLFPAYEEVMLPDLPKARYVKLVISETNTTNGACQVSYFKAYEKI